MLEVRRISKIFFEQNDPRKPGLVALYNIFLAIRKNEFVSLLGPSGCGKTTLIRIIAGLLTADRGEVLVNSQVVNSPGRDRCMVFQQFGLLPWRTVMSNVEFGLEIDGVPRDERRALAEKYLELVGLKGFENYYPHQISGGMQQRVGIARALSKKPEILLMDEPFGAVDAQTREQLQEELLKIWAQTENTVVFVTHSIDEAVYLSDRVVVMQARPGRIKEEVAIDLPRPRWEGAVKADPRFAARLTMALRTDEQIIEELGLRRERRWSIYDYPNLIRLVSVTVFMLLWEYFGRKTDPILFTYPTAVAEAFVKLIAAGEFLKQLAVSLSALAVGFLVSLALGVALGLVLGMSRTVEAFCEPI